MAQAPQAELVGSALSIALNAFGFGLHERVRGFTDGEVLELGRHTLRFLETPHVHHWDSMMLLEQSTRSLFPSDLYIQPGEQPPVTGENLSTPMIELYRGAGSSPMRIRCARCRADRGAGARLDPRDARRHDPGGGTALFHLRVARARIRLQRRAARPRGHWSQSSTLANGRCELIAAPAAKAVGWWRARVARRAARLPALLADPPARGRAAVADRRPRCSTAPARAVREAAARAGRGRPHRRRRRRRRRRARGRDRDRPRRAHADAGADRRPRPRQGRPSRRPIPAPSRCWPGADAHFLAADLREMLRRGITTVRDVGSYGDLVFEARQAMRYGAFRGPRLLDLRPDRLGDRARAGASSTGMYREADGPDDIRRAVREQLRRGADFIKVMTTGARSVELEDPDPAQLTRAEIATLVEEAHRQGYRVAAHAEGHRRHRDRDRGGHRHDRARHVPLPAPRSARAHGRQRPGARADAVVLLRRRRPRRGRHGAARGRRRPPREPGPRRADLVAAARRARAAQPRAGRPHAARRQGRRRADRRRPRLAPVLEPRDRDPAHDRPRPDRGRGAVAPPPRAPPMRSASTTHVGTVAPGKLADLVVIDGDPLRQPGAAQPRASASGSCSSAARRWRAPRSSARLASHDGAAHSATAYHPAT